MWKLNEKENENFFLHDSKETICSMSYKYPKKVSI